MATLVRERSLPGAELELLEYEPVEWRTSLLGCPARLLDPETRGAYSAVVTPGWRILIAHGDDTYEYHTDQAGEAITTCDEHAPPGPETVNVSGELGLAGTERIEIARFDPEIEGYRSMGTVEDPDEIAVFVDLLDLDMPLEPREECAPVMRIDFIVGDDTRTFWFWCGNDVRVLQGEQALWRGQRGVVPREFANLLGRYLSRTPMPQLPP